MEIGQKKLFASLDKHFQIDVHIEWTYAVAKMLFLTILESQLAHRELKIRVNLPSYFGSQSYASLRTSVQSPPPEI